MAPEAPAAPHQRHPWHLWHPWHLSPTLVTSLFLLVALVQTWPLVGHLTDRVPHDLADPLLLVRTLAWNATVLPLTDVWWSPPFFYPMPDAATLTDHLIGLSLLTTPLQWVGLSPLTAYNIAFIASFWLSGVAAWALCRELTGREDAAIVGGLAFMLAPYRLSQEAHLQILATWWLPLIFIALHRARHDPAWRWAAAVAACWLLQGLASAYYLAFGVVMIGLWLIWFGWGRPRLWLRTFIAGVVAAVALLPIVLRYWASFEGQDLQWSIIDIRDLGADLAGLLQIDPSAYVWGPILGSVTPEEQLFPGLAVLVLAALALTRRVPGHSAPLRATRWLLVAAALLLVAAFIAMLWPIHWEAGPISVSLSSVEKPLGIMWACLLLALATSRAVRDRWHAADLAGGYLLMTLGALILALGPLPTIAGAAIWYESPYAWLMRFPGLADLRVPARFWIFGTLGLAVLASLGFASVASQTFVPAQTAARRLAGKAGGRRAAAWGLVVFMSVEGLGRVALHSPPHVVAIPANVRAVLELPIGAPDHDARAMYRQLQHGYPVVNGWSGHIPDEYLVLARDLQGGDVGRLRDLADRVGPLAVIVNHESPAPKPRVAMVEAAGGQCVPGDGVTVCRLARPTTSR